MALVEMQRPPVISRLGANWDDEQVKFYLLLGLSVVPILMAIVSTPMAELISGTRLILTSPSGLFTDYFELTSLGATFLNAGALTLLSLLVVRSQHTPITGGIIAGLFTVFGFALFGKNLFNSIPIPIGVVLYARVFRQPFAKHLPVSLFGTALAPAVSYVAFGEGLPPLLGVTLGYLLGIAIGMVLPPMAAYFARLHQGLSLYNIGFTAGIAGMVVLGLISVLPFEHSVQTVSIFFYGTNLPQAIITYLVSLGFFVAGFIRNGSSFRGAWDFLSHPGRTQRLCRARRHRSHLDEHGYDGHSRHDLCIAGRRTAKRPGARRYLHHHRIRRLR